MSNEDDYEETFLLGLTEHVIPSDTSPIEPLDMYNSIAIGRYAAPTESYEIQMHLTNDPEDPAYSTILTHGEYEVVAKVIARMLSSPLMIH